MPYLIGLDIGTSAAKGVLIDESGAVRATVSSEYPLLTPKPGWAEQDPETWWKATGEVIRGLLAKSEVRNPKSEIKAVGLTGQMHGSVFLAKDGRVIRPALLWCDQRTSDECREITEKAGGLRGLLDLVANPALTGFTAPKILWLRKNEPDNFRKVWKVLLPKDYIRWRLTGGLFSEVSDASGTLLLDVRTRSWSKPLLERIGLSPDLMPACAESPEPTTMLNRAGADATGLAEGTSVVGGGGDQAAGAVGNGIVAPGVLTASLGTSGVLFAASEKPAVDPEGRVHTFCHAVPGRWHMMGVMISAGGSLRWLRDTLCADLKARAAAERKDAYELMTREAEATPPGAEGLLFCPYLQGERTPYPDPHARGAFVGLTLRHGRGHLIRAVLEGVAFGFRDMLELMKAVKVPTKEVVISGGGARSPLWRRIMADVLNLDQVTVVSDEGPAFGAALLAGVGSGVWPSVDAACAAAVKPSGRTRPEPAGVSVYERLYPVYHGLYPALQASFRELAETAGEP